MNTNETLQKNVPNYHVLKIGYIGATNFSPSRVKIRSDRFKQTKVIEYDHNLSNTLEIAEYWLRENGYELIGHAEGKDCYYVITDTFEPFKKK